MLCTYPMVKVLANTGGSGTKLLHCLVAFYWLYDIAPPHIPPPPPPPEVVQLLTQQKISAWYLADVCSEPKPT